ncbi:MAG: hypothetical protein N2578_02180 [Bdellovibrionaceae bacterium]|nr:hypothetical protein [Pseudobdellovibrionaceae bacterium]
MIITILLCLASLANISMGLLEKTITVQTNQTEPAQAKADLQLQANQVVTEELLNEILGVDSAKKILPQVRTQIVPRADRYILFTTPGTLKNTAEGGFSMSMMMRVSVANLKALLQEYGLLTESATLPTLIPLIHWESVPSKSAVRWWTEEGQGWLLSEAGLFERSLRSRFLLSGISVLTPTNFSLISFLPSELRRATLEPTILRRIASEFRVPLVLWGSVHIVESKGSPGAYELDMNLQVIDIVSGTIIADARKRVTTAKGLEGSVVPKKIREVGGELAEELAPLVADSWQSGVVGMKPLRLTVQGRIPLNERDQLMQFFSNRFGSIRNLRERILSSSSVTFEFNSSQSPEEIMARVGPLEFSGRRLEVKSVSAGEIVFELKGGKQ